MVRNIHKLIQSKDLDDVECPPEFQQRIRESLSVQPMNNIFYQDSLSVNTRVQTVDDIFIDLSINGYHHYSDKSADLRKIMYRQESKKLRNTMKRIETIISLKLAKGILLSKLILKRIQLQKKLLIIKIDSHKYVALQSDLNQEKLPQSFKYYDFLISFIEERFPADRRDYLKFRNEIAQQFHTHRSSKQFLSNAG